MEEKKQRIARISKMRENYISLRKKGRTNVEIAEKYGVSAPSVRSFAREYAEENGMDYQDFLDKPTRTFSPTSHSGGRKKYVFAELKEIIESEDWLEEILSMFDGGDEADE